MQEDDRYNRKNEKHKTSTICQNFSGCIQYILFFSRFNIVILAIMIILFMGAYYTFSIYPEIGMVVNSQCSNPTPTWNGQVLGVQVCIF
jgi:hypothetical protein